MRGSSSLNDRCILTSSFSFGSCTCRVSSGGRRHDPPPPPRSECVACMAQAQGAYVASLLPRHACLFRNVNVWARIDHLKINQKNEISEIIGKKEIFHHPATPSISQHSLETTSIANCRSAFQYSYHALSNWIELLNSNYHQGHQHPMANYRIVVDTLNGWHVHLWWDNVGQMLMFDCFRECVSFWLALGIDDPSNCLVIRL